MLRNFLGVLVGLLVSSIIILLIIRIDSNWIQYDFGTLPYKHWQKVINTARVEFFWALLAAGGVSSIIGGIITALIVKRAKQAYAIFIGFLLFLTAVSDIIINQNHPTFYEIGIFFVFFPFSWLGGKLVDWIYQKFFNKKVVTVN